MGIGGGLGFSFFGGGGFLGVKCSSEILNKMFCFFKKEVNRMHLLPKNFKLTRARGGCHKHEIGYKQGYKTQKEAWVLLCAELPCPLLATDLFQQKDVQKGYLCVLLRALINITCISS